MSLTLYVGGNSQQLTLYGVADNLGRPITGAVITGTLTQGDNEIVVLNFTDVGGEPGNYSALLDNFDVPIQSTVLKIDGTVPGGETFALSLACQLVQRTL